MYIFNKNSLEYEHVGRSRRLKIIFILVLLLYIFLGFILGSVTSHPNIVEKVAYTDREISIREVNKFSKDKLIALLFQMKVNKEVIPIIIAQSKHETHTYTSDVYLENNNLFGMKEAYQRATLSTGTNRGHAVYRNWRDSVIDYCLYYNTYLRTFNREQYIMYLKANYADDPDYIIKLSKF